MRTLTWFVCLLSLGACRFGFDERDRSDAEVDLGTSAVAHILVLGEDGEARAGQPVANAFVVAIESDGTTTLERTDTDGRADIGILGDTALHVAVQREDGNWGLASFSAVKDGANVTVGGRPPPATSPTQQLVISLPTFPVGHSQAWITGPRMCLVDRAHAAATSIPLNYDPQCEGMTVDLFATAYNIYVPLGAVTLTNGATVDRSSQTWEALDKVAIEYSNIPSTVSEVGYTFSLPASDGDLIPIANESGPPDALRFNSMELDIPPALFPTGTMLASSFRSASGMQTVFEQVDAWNGNRQFDASTIGVPPIAPTVDQPNGVMTWASDAAQDTDVFWASVQVTLTNQTRVYWNAYGPSATTRATYPALPAELAAIVPTATSVWAQQKVVLAGLSDFDYDGVVRVIDRDVWWWWTNGTHLPSGDVFLAASELPPT